MNPHLEGIWEKMRDLGLGALAHANRHAAYHSMENEKWSDLSILQAAHAAEILLKARIAQEHPLLIFDKFPSIADDDLSLNDLFERGKTVEWNDLPTRLWATTGITLQNLSLYKEFGKIRNGIQHFAPYMLGQATSKMALEFIFGVIDPFIHNCWGLYAIDYDEDHDPYVYFVSSLVNNEILFLVSEESVKCEEYWDVDWTKTHKSYREEMVCRIAKAKSQMQSSP